MLNTIYYYLNVYILYVILLNCIKNYIYIIVFNNKIMNYIII